MENHDELRVELEKLRAENAALKSEKKPASLREISFKVAEKGGLSVYGLGRFPVTLYKEQWIRLLDKQGDIRNFIKDNEEKLKSRE
ncbi:hypothetical protein GCL60_06080 [Silvanigrella paludirubra]|jgi:hypothetical protein|uniref:Uncharacterized protein n=1 Tax=Silvanigrella paludirubra TaxID=2499159 RepID=A0A6N6VVN8_9BACT|nr:hypothetical protein [Silvanigrella paludirubra]KAB8039829.1 hypothetical protein GCL60_06080 [Silvanigrella paludirubra]